MHAKRAFVMVRVVRLHRTDHAQIVDDSAHVREQIADLDAALAARLELPVGFLEIAFDLAELALPVVHGDLLSVIGEQLGLRIERIHVRHAAGHVKEDHALGSRLVMRLFRRQRIG